MLQIWLLYDFYFLMCAYIVAKPYVPMYGLATIYKVEIIQSPDLFTLSVTLCTKFCSKRPTFDKVMVKKLKIPMDPSSQTRERPPSFLILRGLWY